MFVLPTEITQANPDDKHYTVKQKKVPRVSSIVDYAQKNHTKGLKNWIERVGVEEANRIRQEAANIGKKVHKALELSYKDPEKAKNYIANFNEPELKIFVNYKSWRTYFRLEAVESKVFYEDEVTGHSFAGTYDALGTFPDKVIRTKACEPVKFGKRVIVDYKNYAKQKQSRYLVKAFLQLAAYTLGYNQMGESAFDSEPVEDALLVTTSKRQMNMYHLTPDILDFFQQAFIKCLDAYWFEQDFPWDKFLKQIGFGWSEQFQAPVILEDNYIPQRVYFVKEIK